MDGHRQRASKVRLAEVAAPNGLSVKRERRPAYCRIKQCRTHQLYRIRITEQAQCFAAGTLHDDDICGLLAVARQSMVSHFFRDTVDLSKIQDLIGNSNDMDYSARSLQNCSIHQLVGHGRSISSARPLQPRRLHLEIRRRLEQSRGRLQRLPDAPSERNADERPKNDGRQVKPALANAE